jgi:hypothetical protein
LLTTKDHWVCGIFALLMYISLKITLSPTVLSLFGAFLLYWNWRSFSMYCEKRRVGEM